MIPEWAPGIHPLVVHFPLALLAMAVPVDVARLLLPARRDLRMGTSALYAVGALTAAAAFITGRAAADGVVLPEAADPVLSRHAAAATRVLWLYGIYTVVRLLLDWKVAPRARWLDAVVTLLGVAGLPFLVDAGERGAQLVYQHGVGVQRADTVAVSVQPPVASPSPENATMDRTVWSSSRRGADGSWTWNVATHKDGALPGEWLGDAPADMSVAWIETPMGPAAELQASDSGVLVVDGTLDDVQVTLRLRVDTWDGSVAVLHHFVDDATFDALVVDSRSIELARWEEGKPETLDRADIDLGGWCELRLVADGRHLRGYVDDRMVVHAHAAPRPAGKVGLRLTGSGRLGLARMSAEPLTP